jgi:uncharacterized protein YndB with AHSA1/START domain
VVIAAPVGSVFRAVTEQEGLRGWWTRQATAAPLVGHLNEFPFASGDYNAMRVVALDDGRRVEWECVDGAEEWVGTRVVFEMARDGDGTRLEFLHTGWRTETPFFRMCREAWRYYIGSLGSYCEGRPGRPSPLP